MYYIRDTLTRASISGYYHQDQLGGGGGGGVLP